MSRIARLALVAISALPALSVANAHDFFLLSEGSKVGSGPVAISATVGSAFPIPENVVTEDRIATATAKALAGARPISVVGPKEKTLELSLDPAAGPTIVGVALKPRDVEYGEDRIELILGEYQVSAAAKAKVAALPRPRSLKVDSRRFAKTIVCGVSCDGVASISSHGYELEFVPVAPGRFRLIQNGAPLGAYPITMAGSDGKRHEHRTNAKGEVTARADTKGPTMLFASTMTPPAVPGARFILRLTSLTTGR